MHEPRFAFNSIIVFITVSIISICVFDCLQGWKETKIVVDIYYLYKEFCAQVFWVVLEYAYKSKQNILSYVAYSIAILLP